MKLLLGVLESAVDCHLEYPTVSLDELHRRAGHLVEPFPHTEGSRPVVSVDAVFDGYLHVAGSGWSRLDCKGSTNSINLPAQ